MCGHAPVSSAGARPRPRLRVMNGNHYTMFDQVLLSWERSPVLDARRPGRICAPSRPDRLSARFLYLTTTAAPEMWDNSRRNLPVAKLIREWNERGTEPRIRYVTSEDMAARIASLPGGKPALAIRRLDRLLELRLRQHGGRCRPESRGQAGPGRRGTNSGGAQGGRSAGVCKRRNAAATAWISMRSTPGAIGIRGPAWSRAPFRITKDGPVVRGTRACAISAGPRVGGARGESAFSEQSPDHVLLVNPSPVARREWVKIPAAGVNPASGSRCARFVPLARAEYWTDAALRDRWKFRLSARRMKLADLTTRRRRTSAFFTRISARKLSLARSTMSGLSRPDRPRDYRIAAASPLLRPSHRASPWPHRQGVELGGALPPESRIRIF